MNNFLKAKELAPRLRVKVSWVYAHAEGLGAYRLGKYLRFSWSRVLERADVYTHTSAEAERSAARALEQAIYGNLFQTVPQIRNKNSSAALN